MVKLVRCEKRTVRRAAPMGLAVEGADLTDMPPEKSPMPQKAAAKRA
jgi:hypothetical protein